MAKQDNRPIYIIDTSAWIECNERAGDNRIPTTLDRLHGERRIRCPKEVFGELERPGQISDWAKKRRQRINAPRGLPGDYARNLGQVQYEFPAMGRAFDPRDRADPYIVALALTMNSGEQPWIVVTGERPNNRPNRKIVGACMRLQLPVMSLLEMIELEFAPDE